MHEETHSRANVSRGLTRIYFVFWVLGVLLALAGDEAHDRGQSVLERGRLDSRVRAHSGRTWTSHLALCDSVGGQRFRDSKGEVGSGMAWPEVGHLASPSASCITGTTLDVDGGYNT